MIVAIPIVLVGRFRNRTRLSLTVYMFVSIPSVQTITDGDKFKALKPGSNNGDYGLPTESPVKR